jgi:hypothetical protein
MTTQEFVKQEVEAASNQMFPIGNEHESKMIASQEYRNGMAYGLTKGLEIAVKALAFARQNAINGDDGCWDYNPHDQILHSLTDAELLTIFLTEKYENNG